MSHAEDRLMNNKKDVRPRCALARGWASVRRAAYTERGIARRRCVRCASPALFQWQVCADNRIFRPLCLDCDIALNRLVLEWAGDPRWQMKCKKYEKQKRAEYSPNNPDHTRGS